MPDVVDGHVVVLAPEERSRSEWLPPAEDISRGGLPLALGHHPVLHANALSAVSIRPTGDVTGGPDAFRAGAHVLVDQHPAVEAEPRLFCQLDVWPNSHAQDDQLGVEPAPVLQGHRSLPDFRERLTQVEPNAMLFVQRAHESAEV